MKSIVYILFVFSISSIIAQEKPAFQFKTETIDYGKIDKSSNGTRTFEFTNTGSEPLIISRIQTSCGCTVPKKPEKPIMPGEKGSIEVTYDTKRLGGFSKVITIYSNAKTARKVIKIKGFVKKSLSLEKKKKMLSNH